MLRSKDAAVWSPLFGARCRNIVGSIWRMKSGTDTILTQKKHFLKFIFFFENNRYSDTLNCI